MLSSPTTRGGIAGRSQQPVRTTTGTCRSTVPPTSNSSNKTAGAGWHVGAIVWERRNGYTQCVESSA